MTSTSNLEQRLRALEDRLEILNLLAGSALSSDVPSAVYWDRMFAPGAVLDQGGEAGTAGREQLMATIRSPAQVQAIDSGLAHVMALPHIRIDGDRAVATGYLQALVLDPNGADVDLPGKGPRRALAVYHVEVNRWDLVRSADGWQVASRTLRSLATEDAHRILQDGIEGDA